MVRRLLKPRPLADALHFIGRSSRWKASSTCRRVESGTSRYGDLVLGKRNWQIASAGLMLLSIVLALGIVWMSAWSKVIPSIMEVDNLGYRSRSQRRPPHRHAATVERMKRYEIATFIRNARSVCSDPVVEQNMLNDLLAHAHGSASRISMPMMSRKTRFRF